MKYYKEVRKKRTSNMQKKEKELNGFLNFMFCSTCIIVYQYNETNVMQFSFNILRIKGLYMFRALLAHPQEALHKRLQFHCNRGTANLHYTHAVYQVPFV
jgi:hypothetical protein